MKIGLQIERFDFPDGPASIGSVVAKIARTADDCGFDSIWVMDHFFQIRGIGPATDPMLEGMTTLGFVAAHTRRARLGLMVGGVHYRQPALWIKATTTLDVLSGGRAWLGIGAAWNREESEALGFTFPPLGERFELLEDTLRMAHGMWSGERGTEEPYQGKHVTATRLLNAPQSISRPRPPILVGGGGERKTLRLVARYADAANVFGGPEGIHHKWEVLRRHCVEVGRNFDEIERTTLQGANAEPAVLVDRYGELADAGAQHVIVSLREPWRLDRIEQLGRDVIPQIRSF